MRAEKLNQMYDLAERIAAKGTIKETRFSENHPDYFLRDVVVALTEGHLAGRLFATWLPIAGTMYRDDKLRDLVIKRSQDTWRALARSHVFRPDMLIGPKGKLPA